MNRETVTYYKEDIERVFENCKKLREENDLLKREKEELRGKLEPSEIPDLFGEQIEEVEDEVREVKEYGVTDLALNIK